MKRWLFGGGLCLLLGYLYSGAATGAAKAQAANPRPTGWIVATQGKVSLWPNGQRKNAVAAHLCMEFRRGDLLGVAKGAQATVICADLQKYPLSFGVHGLPCRHGNKDVLSYNGSQVVPTRGDAAGTSFPQILSPRKTKLLSTQPTLRWAPVAGATTYYVGLLRGGKTTWSTTVNSSVTDLIYPEDAPRLTVGEAYKLVVVADKRSSEEEGQPGLGFTMLKAEEAQAVRGAEAKIREFGLPEASTRFLIGQLYAAAGLNAEAIEQLKESPDAKDALAATQRLGDLYLTVGLNRLAEEQYLRAFDLTWKATDLPGQARVQKALGQIYEAFGNKREAAQWWRRAEELYLQLGDAKTARQIREALARLQE